LFIQNTKSAALFHPFFRGPFQIFDGLDKFIRVFGVQADGEGVNAAQVFEEHAFAFHDRDSRVRPDVA